MDGLVFIYRGVILIRFGIPNTRALEQLLDICLERFWLEKSSLIPFL